MNSRILTSAVLLSLILSPSLVPTAARAAGWAEIDSPTSRTLTAVDAYSDTIIAVGYDGTVAWSDDGGDTWSDGDSNSGVDLYGVAVINADDAVAVGADGTVIATDDGGNTWDDASLSGLSATEETYAVRAISMGSSTVGFAAGENGLLLKTTNGGSSWSQVTDPSGDATDYNAVYAASATTAWIAGDGGVIYKTTNGGTSWTAEESATTDDIQHLSFSDSSHGWAVGEGTTLEKTTNGGTTWSDVAVSELDDSDAIQAVSFRDTNNGILASADNELLQTDDAGASWNNVDASTSLSLTSILAVSSTEWWGVGESGTIARYDASAPTKPASFDVEGDNDAVVDTTPTFTWSASTDAGSSIDHYEFKMDSGSYHDVNDVTSYTYATALSNGDHTAYLYAVDAAENGSSVATLAFTVDADTTSSGSPDVSTLTPTTAVKGQTVTFSARVSDDGTVESCDLYVDGTNAKTMNVKTDVTYVGDAFSTTGEHTMYARCTDDDGNKTSGAEVTVTVSNTSAYATPGNIIKIGCAGDVYVNDPCTSVYYYGKDGKRHAFPNEYTFKTWFEDFDDLVVLSASAMADIPLGRNVIIRPNDDVLVKFSTSSVYVLSYLGVLRPVANAEIAAALFGSNWVSDIVIVPDVFYGNYRIGSLLESSADYSASQARSVTSSIDATF